MAKAMKISLYGKEDEVVATFERSFVPWKLMKRAIRLSKMMGADGTDINEAALDELAGLVVEVFGDQFTVAQLDEGADVGEMMAVLMAIIGKAGGAVNPTTPG